MVLRPSSILALAALSILPLAACGPMNAKPAASPDPAALCASPATAAGVKQAILGDIDLTTNSGGGAFYRDQIASGAEVTIAKPVMTRFDPQSATVSCSGEARFKWPGGVAARLAGIAPNTDWTSSNAGILYSIQSKPGGGFDYSVQSGGTDIVDTVRSIATALYQADMKGSQGGQSPPASASAPVSAAPAGASPAPAAQGEGQGGGDSAPIDDQTRATIDASRAASGAPPTPR